MGPELYNAIFASLILGVAAGVLFAVISVTLLPFPAKLVKFLSIVIGLAVAATTFGRMS